MATLLERNDKKSRNSCRVGGGIEDDKSMESNFATDLHPATNTKRSYIVFTETCIAHSSVHHGARLSGVPAQFHIKT